MTLKEQVVNGVNILELHGKLEGHNEVFENQMKEFVQKSTNIIVDCSNLDFINSFGLRVFLSSLKTIQSKDGKFLISNLNQNILEIFKISGFSKLFEIYDSKEIALTKF